MDLKAKIQSLLLGFMLLAGCLSANAQDLLARQAPVDKRMKTVDTLALKSIIQREQLQTAASSLYQDWNNKYAHKATELPDSFTINLRHFAMPTTSRVITSNFGRRWGRMHKGLDVKVYIGDTIRAAFDGKVRIVKYEAGGYGNYVVIRHNNGLETIYGHMSKHLVAEDQPVRAGEPIGLGGNTGRSTGSHLHFETRLCGVALNPALMFDFRNQDVTGDTYLFRRTSYQRENTKTVEVAKANASESAEEQASEQRTIAKKKQEAAISDVRYHKVERGETLYSIARKRGITVSRLMQLNNLGKGKRIRPGQILRYS